MEDWRNESSELSEAKLLAIARQSKLINTFHWIFPLWNIIGSAISATRTKNLISLAPLYAVAILGTWLTYNPFIGYCIAWIFVCGPMAMITIYRIQSSRNKIDRRNSNIKKRCDDGAIIEADIRLID